MSGNTGGEDTDATHVPVAVQVLDSARVEGGGSAHDAVHNVALRSGGGVRLVHAHLQGCSTFSSSSSAKYEPSCPVMPVTRATLDAVVSRMTSAGGGTTTGWSVAAAAADSGPSSPPLASSVRRRFDGAPASLILSTDEGNRAR